MYFAQQEVTQVVTGSATAGQPVSVNLTGFRAGEVRSIILWLTDNTLAQGSGFVTTPMSNVLLTYNGEIFSRFDLGSEQIWNLSSDEKSSSVNTTTLNAAGTTATAYQSNWVVCPFSQVNIPYDRETKLMHGKPILNAVVNLQFNTPNTNSYTLHAMYLYNASLLCSRGSAEYIF
jgi:hypothetical protein